ncbi:Branched-chain amino acid transport system permease protein livH (plasmid) [Roseomonas mucosa]|uniref:Branched-chain amino acid transport system permease protein livH n=1 Tax=Roseomonas mucosa TaxID=207340 RepID=A0A4Y1MRJ3_9PROT|nr:ABC transporter permease [Roseomonas mucosa]AWV20601.1 Branched-chain amino acid transport system permease protein livH [Roseomonas mucosa]MDT8278363.1 ABC transporter permease [Roseomonas mucosa]MDT8356757.1 ABC transporter permease [Roseomonas mucosa]
MDSILPQLLTGLTGASSLFLVASGLTIIFGVTRIVNFSHGSLTMLGAYIGWTILTHLPRDPTWFILGVLATALVTAAIGAALELTVLRRIYRAPELFQLLATFGVVLVLQDVTLRLWGPVELPLPRPRWMRGFVEIADNRFPFYDLILIAVGPVVLGLLWLLMNRTRWGTLVRAATLDRDMVAALGVNQRTIFTTVFALGAGLAGLGGALSLPNSSANLGIDLSVITDAFVVVVVGGLGSLGGAFLASLLIGILQAFGIVLVPKITLVLVFLVMAVVLIFRPNGLLGRAQTEAREAIVAAPVVRPAPPALRLLGLAALLVAVAAPFLVGEYTLIVLTDALVAILFATSLHFMMGPGGMASFGHAAWFGIGAYVAGLLLQWLSAPMPVGLLAAPVAAGIVAAVFGWFVVRLSGVYLSMLTLAFAQIVWAIAFQWVDVTGGDNGLLGLVRPAWAADARAFYWLALVLSVGVALLLRRALYAPYGYALRAARDSTARARSIGLDVTGLRIAAIVVAGSACGLAGALFSYGKGSIFPTYITISHSVEALLMVLLGGLQTMAGPIIGAIIYTGLADILVRSTDLWRLVLGAVIVFLVIAFPEGIAGAVRRLWLRGREA